MHDNAILRVVAKIFIPAIMLFALYVQFHGDYGPGGGFQAGVIFAAAFILHSIIFGTNRARHVWSFRLNLLTLCVGVLLYGITGLVAIFRGANYLNYYVVGGQHLGILLVELGVGLTVAASMVMLFFAFASRRAHSRLLNRDAP